MLDGWHCSLLGAPSQCYKPVYYNGKKYTLYLRWRGNPWQFIIIRGHHYLNDYGKFVIVDFYGFISVDLFESYGCVFKGNKSESDVDLEEIQKAAEDIFNEVKHMLPELDRKLIKYKMGAISEFPLLLKNGIYPPEVSR